MSSEVPDDVLSLTLRPRFVHIRREARNDHSAARMQCKVSLGDQVFGMTRHRGVDEVPDELGHILTVRGLDVQRLLALFKTVW